MTKEQCLQILKLLSALEAWSFATKSHLPDYLLEDLKWLLLLDFQYYSTNSCKVEFLQKDLQLLNQLHLQSKLDLNLQSYLLEALVQ